MINNPSFEPRIPFSAEEFETRLQKLRQSLVYANIDMVWVTSPDAMYYFTGYRSSWYRTQSSTFWPPCGGIAVHKDHDDYLIFDTVGHERLIHTYTYAKEAIYLDRADLEGSLSSICSELKARNWLMGTIGLELQSCRPNPLISKAFEAQFTAAGCIIKDVTKLVRDCRRLKSPKEIDYIERAAEICDIGLIALQDAIEPGISELELYGALTGAMHKAGGGVQAISQPVWSGTNKVGHGLSGHRHIKTGDPIWVDVCGVFEQYHSNAARNYCLGLASDKAKNIFQKAAGVFNFIEDNIKPGMSFAEFSEHVLAYYLEFGDIWPHRGWVGGYEMGIAFPPDWVGEFLFTVEAPNEEDGYLEENFVCNFESVFPRTEQFEGASIIDTFIVRQDRIEFLHKPERQLIEIS